MKEKFTSLLSRCFEDEAITKTIVNNLESLRFFKAPASTRYHLNVEGGLVQHSLSVCDIAMRLREMAVSANPELEEKLPLRSVILCALLHDICKAEVYKTTLRNVKNDVTGVWEKKPYYEADYSYLPLGHGEKSVIRLIAWGVHLTVDEMLAIRWHMGPWELPMQSYDATGNHSAARDKSPLVSLIQAADNLSSAVFEKNPEK